MNTISRIFLLLILFLLAACGGGESTETSDLPTLAQLPTATNTPLVRPTLPPTFTPTPTNTVTPSPTISLTFTITPSLTITDTTTPTPTRTLTNTPEPRAVNSLLELALQATVLPSDYYVPGTQPGTSGGNTGGTGGGTSPGCSVYPAGGFGLVFSNDPTLAAQLGCPTGNPPLTLSLQAAYQQFERGTMIWLVDTPTSIYVLYSDGSFQRFDDSFVPGVDPVSGGELSPPGLFEPVNGFGKVWRTFDNVRAQLGWATIQEAGTLATVQNFERGRMVHLPNRGDILIFTTTVGGAMGTTGSWRSVPGTF